MDTSILVSLVGLLGTVAAAVLTYWTTKKRERDSEWRKEKLIYYKTFVDSLSGIVEGDDTPDGHRLYARATNNLLLFAPQAVIDAVNAFRTETRAANPARSQERHDQLLANMLFAIRRDVGIVPPDQSSTFAPVLWASGAKPKPPGDGQPAYRHR